MNSQLEKKWNTDRHRSFFAEKAFEEQIYESSSTILPYEDYAAGNVTKGKKKATESSTVMRVLRRNRSKRVDMFLDWLVRPLLFAF